MYLTSSKFHLFNFRMDENNKEFGLKTVDSLHILAPWSVRICLDTPYAMRKNK